MSQGLLYRWYTQVTATALAGIACLGHGTKDFLTSRRGKDV